MNRVYADGAFESMNYSKPLVPPLRGNDAEWAAELIANRLQKRATN
jgi:hypothetical protein